MPRSPALGRRRALQRARPESARRGARCAGRASGAPRGSAAPIRSLVTRRLLTNVEDVRIEIRENRPGVRALRGDEVFDRLRANRTAHLRRALSGPYVIRLRHDVTAVALFERVVGKAHDEVVDVVL